MVRQFPLNRGSHPQPPLYPDSGSVVGSIGVLTGSVDEGSATSAPDKETPIVVSVSDSNPNGSTVHVTLTAIGCTFSDGSTTKTAAILSGSSGSLSAIALRPKLRDAQARVVATFRATDRSPSEASIDIVPQPIPAPLSPGGVLGTEDVAGVTEWVRTDHPTVSRITVTDQAEIVGAFGCNGASPKGAVALPADASDLPSAIALLNAIKALLIGNGQGS